MSDDDYVERIERDPRFRSLAEQRGRLEVTLTILILIIYFGFILLIAFAPGFLGTPFAGSVITYGIPIGISVIISAFILTGIYVVRANTTYDRLNAELLRGVKDASP
jgi:uncharacterized membrane protein (DUF485 family)